MRAILVITAMVIFFPQVANAYIDPATGGLLMQALAGIFLAGAATFKIWWHRLKNVFSFLLGKKNKTEDGIK